MSLTSSNALFVNETNSLTVSMKANSALQDALVDFELYNSSNQRVVQKVFEHETLGLNQSRIYTLSWKPTQTGTYTLRTGVFTSNWSSLIQWENTAATFSVQVRPVVATTVAPASAATTQVWWPSQNATISGVQPFKAVLSATSLSDYQMYWQVDGGQLNFMNNSLVDVPHKESLVNVSGWNWRGNGPYTLNFVAKNASGQTIAQKQVAIYIGTSSQQTAPATPTTPVVNTTQTQTTQTTTSPPTQTSAPAQTATAPTATSVSGLYVNPNSPALVQAQQWQSSRPADAALMKKIGDQPSARWFGNWNANIYTDVKSYVDAAASANATPVLIAYNIPQRDCGGYSAGGSNDPAVYRQWITDMARGIGNRSAMIILEPDSVALNDCLSSTDKQTRFGLLSYAVDTLKANSNARVYIDAGHSSWVGAQDMANRLTQAGIARANGFALNVSNFYSTQDNVNYGTQVSQYLNGKHFVVDTSRNGRGSNGQWCNPSDRALGEKPTLSTGNSLVDGFLWLKTPGESDGSCNGGPSAGQWWPEYALGLAQRSSW
ncbi:MAG: glycoside hydrolase family 6 protein [Candidatus Magasanikbacteria bacterium]